MNFRVTMDVSVRRCKRCDLRKLEWFGLYAEHRAIFDAEYARHKRGHNVMLVAEANGFPIGQVWIDIEKKRHENVAVIWALRVIPNMQGLGIGSRLVEAAEELAISEDCAEVELGVEKKNLKAKRLYQRLGYRVVGELDDHFVIDMAAVGPVTITLDEWLLRKHLPAQTLKSVKGSQGELSTKIA